MNKYFIGEKHSLNNYKRVLTIMKITLFFLFFGILVSQAADIYSQETKFTLNLKSTTIKEVCKEIEKKSDYRFVFAGNTNKITNKKVNVTVNSQEIAKILDDIMSDTELSYKILGKQVAVYYDKSKESTSKIEPTASEETAQQPKRQIKGRVVDTEGLPVIGANIVETGTTNGTVTDVDGAFSLNVDNNASIRISYIGYLEQNINTTGRANLNIVLQEDTQALNEVVVIGYGTRAKRDLTGAVSQINEQEITKTVSMSPEFAMQGKMAGVFISNTGSSPTARPSIQIRGISTLGSNDPLYVIDGIPLTEGGSGAQALDARLSTHRGSVNIFNMINSNDIESISVLKDASATAIYGVRASNGVILITTKRGSKGKPKVNLTTSFGVQNIHKRYQVTSIQDYVDWSLEAIAANRAFNTSTYQHYPLFDKNSPFYMVNSTDYRQDWLNAGIKKNAIVQDYNLNISGGNEGSNYSLGTGYSEQEDVMYRNNFKRLSFFVNSDHTISSWLKLGESYRLAYSKNTPAFTTPDFQTLSFVPPWQPLYDATELYGFARPGTTRNGIFYPYGYGEATKFNFLGLNNFAKNERNFLRHLGSVYAEVIPVKGLRIRGTFSFDYLTNKNERLQADARGLYENVRGIPYTSGNVFDMNQTENINLVKEFLVGYNESFGNHSFDLVFNAMDQDIKWNVWNSGIVTNSPITSWEQRYINEGWPSADKTTYNERYASGLIGYMGRGSYNYARKYYIDATLRRDGTSKFASGYKWGTFPSFGAAWRISSEKFMGNINWLDDLKVRAGWGKTGNQETRDFAFLSLVNFNPKAAFGSIGNGEGIIYPGGVLGDFPIIDMSWETVTTYSLGFDMITFNNKFSLTAEYYKRLTDGILQQISIPDVIGALTSPVVNLAKVSNDGFEFQLGYNDSLGDISFNASANLTTVRNRVSNLYRGQPATRGNIRIENGYPMNFIYGYKTDGIFQTQAEVDAWLKNNNDAGNSVQKAPGDIRFIDLNGAPKAGAPDGTLKDYNPDGRIDSYDMTYLGKTIPGYYYGINMGVNYKKWDVSLFFRGIGDVQKINTNGLQSIAGGGNNFLSKYRERWTPTNPSNTIPRAIQGDPSGNNRISDRHVQNAGFFRFQNFQIGYSFHPELLSKIKVSNLRLYISGTNLFVVSPYDDLDPENITTPTTFTFGANISF